MKKQEELKSAEEVEQEFRKKCLGEAGIGYSAGAALIILISVLFSLIVGASTKFPTNIVTGEIIYPDWYLYFSYLLPQFCLFGAALMYFLRTKEPVRTVTKSCKWYYFLIAIALQMGLMFPVSELNDLFVEGLSKIGYHGSGVNVPSLDGWNLLPAILVIAVLPAILEETLFRGILSRNMHASGWGLVPTIFVTGALFSIYHGNPEQTLYQFASGVCLSFVAVKSGSIFPTVVAHFLNNALILIFEATGFGASWTMSLGVFIALIVLSSLLFLGALAFLIFFDRKGNQKGKVVNGKRFFFCAAAGIGICAIEWVVQLITGFLS
ncbi:MAG: CPBP family intramembrane metalloprotease [Clostridia bacterium]|nr:CPBP family intramembrane metalloprotease [Clostridia bacterium]